MRKRNGKRRTLTSRLPYLLLPVRFLFLGSSPRKEGGKCSLAPFSQLMSPFMIHPTVRLSAHARVFSDEQKAPAGYNVTIDAISATFYFHTNFLTSLPGGRRGGGTSYDFECKDGLGAYLNHQLRENLNHFL